MYCAWWFDLDSIQGQGHGHGGFWSSNKCSAVAEVGDHLATIDMDRKLREGAVPLSGRGAGSTSNTMWPAPTPPRSTYLPSGVLIYPIRPFGHNKHGPKIGWLCPFWGRELGPHQTQCHLAKAYLHAKFHLDPSSHLATIDMGRKLGAALACFGGWEMGSHLTQCGLGRGLPLCQMWWLTMIVLNLVYSLSEPNLGISFEESYHVSSNFVECWHYTNFKWPYFRIASG